MCERWGWGEKGASLWEVGGVYILGGGWRGGEYLAELTAERTNLSPFTKDYRAVDSRMRLE